VIHDKPTVSRFSGRSRLEQVGSLALLVIAIGGLGMLLYIGRAAFVPVAFALLFALVLSTPVEWLHRQGIPRSLASALVLVCILGAAGMTLRAVWGPARTWFDAIPHAIEIVEQRIGPVARALEQRYATPNLSHPTDSPAALIAEQVEMSASGTLLMATPAAAADVITIVILTLFLLTGGAPMTARLASTLISDGKSMKALRIVEAVRSEVSRYYATIALINLGLGAATAAVTMLLQVPNPLLWGTVAAVFNFVPYVGSTVTLLVLTIVSMVTFGNIGHVVAVVASFLVLLTIEGQIVEPLLVGKRLKLSPIVVLLALWFAGWFWGISGIFLAIPFLVAVRVVAAHIPNGRIMVDLLTANPQKRFTLIAKTHDGHPGHQQHQSPRPDRKLAD
jgi:predicted PurR-regulated permease PerM